MTGTGQTLSVGGPVAGGALSAALLAGLGGVDDLDEGVGGTLAHAYVVVQILVGGVGTGQTSGAGGDAGAADAVAVLAGAELSEFGRHAFGAVGGLPRTGHAGRVALLAHF